MTMPLSGQISLSQANVELSKPATAQIALNDGDVRSLAGIASGTIRMSDLYGKSRGSFFASIDAFLPPGAMTADIAGNTYFMSQFSAPNHVVKMNGGGAIEWQYLLGSSSQQLYVGKCEADNFGNVYVIGQISSQDASGNYAAAVLLKFNSTGSLLWQKEYGRNVGSRIVNPAGFAFDSSGNLYIPGSIRRDTVNSEYDGFMLKIDPSGNIISQRMLFAGVQSGFGSIEVDAGGTVYVGGGIGDKTISMMKLNSNLDFLSCTNLTHAIGPSYGLSGLAVNSSGEVYLAGTRWSGTHAPYLLKLNSSGGLLWHVGYNVSSSSNNGQVTLDLDGAGNPWLAVSTGPTAANTDRRATIIKFSPDAGIWTQSTLINLNGNSSAANGIAYKNGSVHVFGNFTMNYAYRGWQVARLAEGKVPYGTYGVWSYQPTNLQHVTLNELSASGPGYGLTGGDFFVRDAAVSITGSSLTSTVTTV